MKRENDEFRSRCRELGIWYRRVNWEHPRNGLAITDVPTSYLKDRKFSWAVYHLKAQEKLFAVSFDDLREALRDAPIRDQGRKVGPYKLDVEGGKIDGRPVTFIEFDPTDLSASLASLEATQLELMTGAPLDDWPAYFDPSMFGDHRERVLRSIAHRRGQKKFRDGLMTAYAGRCAVTGTALPELLEAAHIIPYRGPKFNALSNGLLLRTDVHTLFDLRLLGVDPDFKVVVSNRVVEPLYRELHGKFLQLPVNPAQRPAAMALASHRQGLVDD